MRKFFPDTGINLKVFNEYKAIQDRYGIQIFMFFVDDEAGLIYGETLNIISAQHVCMYGGFRNKGTLYPLIDRRIIYFPVEVMREIAVIGVESLKMLAELTTKKQAYKSQI